LSSLSTSSSSAFPCEVDDKSKRRGPPKENDVAAAGVAAAGVAAAGVVAAGATEAVVAAKFVEESTEGGKSIESVAVCAAEAVELVDEESKLRGPPKENGEVDAGVVAAGAVEKENDGENEKVDGFGGCAETGTSCGDSNENLNGLVAVGAPADADMVGVLPNEEAVGSATGTG